MVTAREMSCLFTGAMIALVLNLGVRGIFGITVWQGEAVLYFATLIGLVVFDVLDGLRERRDIKRKIGILEHGEEEIESQT